jgi:ferredoxin
MRISRPIINAPGKLAVALGVALVALSIFKPALSGPPADISNLTATPETDWFYLFPFPLADALSATPSNALLAAVAGFFLLALAPWMIRDAPTPPAVVDLAHCTGCEQCQKACPFEAISIKPRSDGRPYEQEVEILPERCASCGLCLPACPFPALAIGPWTKEYFTGRINALLPNGGAGKTIIFSCERAVADERFYDEIQNAAVITVPCVGILGAKTIEECLGAGVDGVAVVSCVSEDCHYRLSRRKLDITRIEISGIRRLKIIEASTSDPGAALDAVREAVVEFAVARR